MRREYYDPDIRLAGRRREKEGEYWSRKLAGEPVKSSLPYDWSQTGDSRGETLNSRVSGRLFHDLTTLSSGSDFTLHLILSAGLTALMHRCTGSSDIMILSPIYKQKVEGKFLNTVLILRNQIEERMSFKSLLLRMRQTVGEAVENQDYPLELLSDRYNLRIFEKEYSLIDVGILLRNIHDKRYIEHIPYKLLFSFSRSAASLELNVEYDSSLYEEATTKRFAALFTRLLEGAVRALDGPLADIEILSEEEKKQVLFDFNDTTVEYPKDKTIHRLFEEQVYRCPDKTVVSGPSTGIPYPAPLNRVSVTYRQLNRESNRLARELSEKGVTPGTVVGLMVQRSLEMVTGMLAILKAGGAYLPIDPLYPEERRRYMLDESGLTVLLTQRRFIEENAGDRECIPLDGGDPGLSPGGEPWVDETPVPMDNPRYSAYVMYTSGSTGRPKGVIVDHRNVVRLVVNTHSLPLKANTRHLQTGSPVFDATTFEVWGVLLNAGGLFLVERAVILDAFRLEKALLQNCINTLFLSSPLFHQLSRQKEDMFPGLKYLFVGGDVLNPRCAARVRSKNPRLQIVNGYGPTENTTFSTTFCLHGDHGENIPIGKPVTNSTCYIVDGNLNPQPVGVPGELIVGGDGVAAGYMNNPELTAERFYRSHKSYGTYISYRTGDLARWLPDGNIEFIGRIDQQVKIRGFRVELGEIEARLRTHMCVKEAIVIDREGPADGEDRWLAAYIVPSHPETVSQTPGHSPLINELKEYLARELPEYMVPSFFAVMEALPLSPNGKLDRRALEAVEAETAAASHTPPRDAVEKKLEKIWTDILSPGLSRFGIDSNFFDLGGHSLKATALAAKIHKEFSVKIPLEEVFCAPTIRELSEYIRTADESRYASIEAVEKKEYYPLSSAQKRMFTLYRMKDKNDTSDNSIVVIAVEGKLDVKRFENVVSRIVNRHEILRTSFDLLDYTAVQRVREDIDFKVDYYDTDGMDVTGEDAVVDALLGDFVKPFDLSAPPLFRVALIKCPGDKHLLFIDMHHIIQDGTSLGVLTGEFHQLYEGVELRPLRIQYRDFAAWQNKRLQSAEIKKQEEYWLNLFSGELPQMELPTDFPGARLRSFEGDCIYFDLSEGLTERLNTFARENNTTLYAVLLAIYNILLARYCGREDIVVGSVIANRTHPDLQHMLGFTANTLAMRNFPRAGTPFEQFCREVRANCLKAFENQDYQFDQLVHALGLHEGTGRQKLFNTVLVVQNTDVIPGGESPLGRSPVTFKPYPFKKKTTQFDILLQVFENTDGITVKIEYSTELFKKDTVERMIRHFINTTEEALENPGINISEIRVFSDEETENARALLEVESLQELDMSMEFQL